MGFVYFWTDHFIAQSKQALEHAKWISIGQVIIKKIQRKFLLNVAYNPLIFPLKFQVETCGLNECKTSCDSSTHFAYFNYWPKVDGETSIVKFGHHSKANLEGLTKFWGFEGSSATPYSPFCTLKTCPFDPIPLANPNCDCHHTHLPQCLLLFVACVFHSYHSDHVLSILCN